ncbi:OLC1v1020500C1 [Oldenlandia corymbosa var. corymbosa]|uniref:OLC1v1020500C1 n=1 Tax=Oldenlandia corymbosa var. corymbosa TaxID=529605 RepID=A0AAV1EGP1_OLDCO|nr:OLC1v1020500C1 [Oldenlandia corymbosa var. corymbosa]
MAIGLEKSGQKFLWVLRDGDKGDLFKDEGGGDHQVKEVQVASKDIENAVRMLMNSAEGHQMRQRAQEMSKAVKASLMDNGTPFGVDSFVAHIRR